MKLTKADHNFMAVCELDAVDMPTPELVAAMKHETQVLNDRAEYCTRAVRSSYLRLAAYRDVLHTRQRSVARYA